MHNVKSILQKNNFPLPLIDQNISSYLNDKYSTNITESEHEATSLLVVILC